MCEKKSGGIARIEVGTGFLLYHFMFYQNGDRKVRPYLRVLCNILSQGISAIIFQQLLTFTSRRLFMI